MALYFLINERLRKTIIESEILESVVQLKSLDHRGIVEKGIQLFFF